MKDHIAKIVGANRVSDSEEDLLAYSYDGSFLEAMPKLVVWPKTVEEIRAILLFLGRSGTSLVPRGNGTGFVGGAIGEGAAILDMTLMDKIKKLNVREKYVDVEPGITLKKLNDFLRTEHLFFPITPENQKTTTIGSMFATNALSIRSYGLGKMENWVEEIEFLDGTGKFYKTKSVEKFIGTEGTVSIITNLKLKVIPSITGTTTSVFGFMEIPDMINRLQELKKNESIIALEFLDKMSSTYVGLKDNYHLLVEFESDDGKLNNIEEIEKVWLKRNGLNKVLDLKGYMLREDTKIPTEKLYDMIIWCEHNQVPCYGHIGLGILNIRFMPKQKGKIEELYDFVRKINGFQAGMYGYGLKKKRFMPQATKNRIIKLKEEFDYNNLLNRGKMVDYR
ncbi:MAG: FAD-binding oxidoreductase [archaeon]